MATKFFYALILTTFLSYVLVQAPSVRSADNIAGIEQFAQTSNPAGCPDGWDTTFYPNGANNQINAIVADGMGNVYVGGEFTSIQGVPARGIAKWDGSTWSALGTGIAGNANSVYAIAVSGSDVYIGGSFNTAGGVSSKNIAKWDGTSWSGMGVGLGGGTHIVRAVAVYDGDVYVGGSFTTSDGSPTTGLARWDGTSFSAVGTALASNMRALTVNGGFLYAGGSIAPTGGASVGVARWDGSSWSTIGTSTTSTVHAITFSAGDMYIVGSRIVVPGLQDMQVGKWNGTTWTRLGFFSNGIPNAVAVIGNDLYVGGYLPDPPNLFNSLARWNGTTWSGVGTGIQGGGSIAERVMALAAVGNKLYIGGNYTSAGGLGAQNLSTYSTGTWAAFPGTGLSSPPRAIAASGSDVYVGGDFQTAGTVSVNRIARWDGNAWQALGSGVSGTVSAIVVAGNKVYVGGTFQSAGGVSARNVAVWNGQHWSALGGGVDSTVTAILVRGQDVYVAGAFQSAGETLTNRIAKWNGSSWSGFPSAPIPNTVTGMAFAGDDLYIASTTNTVENPNYLLKFDGTNWTGLAPGMGGHGISSLSVIGTDVYVTGQFTSIAGVSANRIAKWNGSTWSALGAGIPAGPFGQNNLATAVSGTDLIVIGAFNTAGGAVGERIVKWNGTDWLPLGNGLDNIGTVVAASGGEIYAGGQFATAGCNVSTYFARYRNILWTGSAGSDWHTPTNWGAGAVPGDGAAITIDAANASITTADVTLNGLNVTSGRTLSIGAGRNLTVNGNLVVDDAFLTGSGDLTVNGDLTLNNGSINGLSNIVVTGTVYVASGSAVGGSGTLNINGDLSLAGGTITGLSSMSVSGRLDLTAGTISTPGPVTLTSCNANALTGGSASAVIRTTLVRCVAPSGTYRFPVGTASGYAPVEISNASGSATITVVPRAGAYSQPAVGLPADRLLRWWQISGGAINADLSFGYSDPDVVGPEVAYRAHVIQGGTATRLSSSVDMAANKVTALGVSQFGDFTLAAATPFPATLAGRITTQGGRGAYGVFVRLTEASGVVRYAQVNMAGYYRFNDVETFRTHTLTLVNKRYGFTSIQRTVVIDESVSNIDFQSTDP